MQHTIWRLTDTASLVKSFELVPLLYIADGHHRAASASRARAELKEQSAHTGKEDYNYFLTVIFPDSQMQILRTTGRSAGSEWPFERAVS